MARLARLQLEEAEIDEFARELSEILQYVEQLDDINVEGFLPANQVTGLTNVMRPDEIKNYGYDAAALMKNVPRASDNQILVNRMIG